jgi:hypothetical protein
MPPLGMSLAALSPPDDLVDRFPDLSEEFTLTDRSLRTGDRRGRRRWGSTTATVQVQVLVLRATGDHGIAIGEWCSASGDR